MLMDYAKMKALFNKTSHKKTNVFYHYFVCTMHVLCGIIFGSCIALFADYLYYVKTFFYICLDQLNLFY
jgi:hypothetical protein